MEFLGNGGARHRRALWAEGAGTLGNDGLTDEERRGLLTSFRQGIGAKPAPDAWFLDHANLMADKLADSSRRGRQ